MRGCGPVQNTFRETSTAIAVSTPSCAGTLFGPSSKAVLDPSGTICPFADAAGGWLPLLCTLNCTGVTEEVRLGLLRPQAVMGHHGLLCRGWFTPLLKAWCHVGCLWQHMSCKTHGAPRGLWQGLWHAQPPCAAHPPSKQVRLTVGKCLDHDSMTNEVRTYCAPIALTS